MTRITIKDLECIVNRLNRMTASPATPYTRDAQGKFVANIGNYHISQAYGGVCLHRMVNTGGGVSDVLMCGHVPRRELQSAMFAYIRGMEEPHTVASYA